MNSQLLKLAADFETAKTRLHRLSDSLPEERWRARRDPARWSVAECVAHLNLTSLAYESLFRQALNDARTLGKSPGRHYRMDMTGRLIAFFAGPLPRIGGLTFGRAKTTAAFIPSGALSRDELVAEFDRLQEVQIGFARAADGLPIDDVDIPSVFAPRLTYNLYSGLVITARHQERHLNQAEAVWS